MALWSQLPLFPHCSGCFWGACSAFCKEKKAIIEVMRTTATGMCQFGSIAVSMAGAMAMAMACVAACSTAAFCTPPYCSLFFFAGESDEFQELWESTEEETKRVKAALDRAASAFVSMLAGGGMWGGWQLFFVRLLWVPADLAVAAACSASNRRRTLSRTLRWKWSVPRENTRYALPCGGKKEERGCVRVCVCVCVCVGMCACVCGQCVCMCVCV